MHHYLTSLTCKYLYPAYLLDAQVNTRWTCFNWKYKQDRRWSRPSGNTGFNCFCQHRAIRKWITLCFSSCEKLQFLQAASIDKANRKTTFVIVEESWRFLLIRYWFTIGDLSEEQYRKLLAESNSKKMHSAQEFSLQSAVNWCLQQNVIFRRIVLQDAAHSKAQQSVDTLYRVRIPHSTT
jgi:hypothetical protein